MIDLLPEETDQILRFEKSILKFKGFSFENYSELKIINAYLHAYITKLQNSNQDQVLIDMFYEIEQENECLNSLRFSEDKNATFKDHVKATANIIKQLIECLSPPITSVTNKVNVS
jgi:hypothetical protein